MKKQKRTLKLNKSTISNLNKEEGKKIKAGSIIFASCACVETESCSVIYCCPPTTKQNNEQERNPG